MPILSFPDKYFKMLLNKPPENSISIAYTIFKWSLDKFDKFKTRRRYTKHGLGAVPL